LVNEKKLVLLDKFCQYLLDVMRSPFSLTVGVGRFAARNLTGFVGLLNIYLMAMSIGKAAPLAGR
jgi:hypothetical protein